MPCMFEKDTSTAMVHIEDALAKPEQDHLLPSRE